MPAHGGARPVATCVWAAGQHLLCGAPAPAGQSRSLLRAAQGLPRGCRAGGKQGLCLSDAHGPRPARPALSSSGTRSPGPAALGGPGCSRLCCTRPSPRILAAPPFLAALSLEGSGGSQQQANCSFLVLCCWLLKEPPGARSARSQTLRSCESPNLRFPAQGPPRPGPGVPAPRSQGALSPPPFILGPPAAASCPCAAVSWQATLR